MVAQKVGGESIAHYNEARLGHWGDHVNGHLGSHDFVAQPIGHVTRYSGWNRCGNFVAREEVSGMEFVHALGTLASGGCKPDEAAIYLDKQGMAEEAVDENGEEENVYLNQQALICQDGLEVKSAEKKLELRREIRAQSAEPESESDP